MIIDDNYNRSEYSCDPIFRAQVRTHAQKYFMKLEKHGKDLSCLAAAGGGGGGGGEATPEEPAGRPAGGGWTSEECGSEGTAER